jgi:hypothetical protein
LPPADFGKSCFVSSGPTYSKQKLASLAWD